MKKRTAVALGVWLALIFFLSVLPLSVPGPIQPFVPTDFVAHALFYIPLGAIAAWTHHAFSAKVGRRAAFFAVGLGVAIGYGALMELIQAALPWRSFEYSDMAADLLGGAVGALAAALFPNLGQRPVPLIGKQPAGPAAPTP